MSKATQTTAAFTLGTATLEELSKNERLKVESEGLFYVAGKEKHTFRSEIEAMVRGEALTLTDEAKEISKHFGAYKQQERQGAKRDGAYIFMVRLKNPGCCELSAKQWQAIDHAADEFGNGTLRLTSRQGIQFHYVPGSKLGPLVRFLNRGYRPRATLGACGDVNRNVMCCPVDGLDRDLSHGAHALAHAIAEELAPKSSAYFQIFQTNDEGQTLAALNSDEPLYGKHYLPRKFKIALGQPEENCVDVLTNDIAFVPVVNGKESDLYDLYTGGGLGLTHNMPKTAALLALYLGRIHRSQVIQAARAITILQKENGERKDRRQARWKYTLRRLGREEVMAELRDRFGLKIEEVTPQPLRPLALHLGWRPQKTEGLWYRGVSVENGRLHDTEKVRLRSAVHRLVDELGLGIRITGQQDLLLCNIPEKHRADVNHILAEHGVPAPEALGAVRRTAMACPARPTCGLAMTEAERVLPSYIEAIEAAGLGNVDVAIRMTGCPNGCARPSTAEIGIYGYGKNDHVILVGGTRSGTRLGRILYARVPEQQMIHVLTGIVRAIRDHADGRPADAFLDETPIEQLRAWVGWDEAAHPA